MPSRPDLILAADIDLVQPDGQRSYRVEVFPSPEQALGLPPWPTSPQMGVAVLGTYLRSKGFHVRAFDNILRLPIARQRFLDALDSRPLAVGVSTSMLSHPESLRKTTGWVRERCPETCVVLGGMSAEFDPAIREFADVVVLGPGERSMELLLCALKDGRALADIPNLLFRKGGGWVQTPAEANVGVGELPPTDWSVLDTRASLCYSIEASRGCRHDCAFCNYRDRRNQRFRPIPAVVEEMRRDQAAFGARFLRFVDNDLPGHPEHLETLCGAILKARLDIPWSCFGRAADFAGRPALAHRMREAGCFAIHSGIESGSDILLRNMRKGYTASQSRAGVARLREAGIQIHASFIVGFPGETRETLAATLDFIRETELDSAQFFALELCEGTDADIVAHKSRYGIEGTRSCWRHATMDSIEARRLTRRCVEVLCTDMPRTSIGGELLLSYKLLAGGLSLEEAGGYLHALKSHYRAQMLKDAILERQSLGRIAGYYSKMGQTLRGLGVPLVQGMGSL